MRIHANLEKIFHDTVVTKIQGLEEPLTIQDRLYLLHVWEKNVLLPCLEQLVDLTDDAARSNKTNAFARDKSLVEAEIMYRKQQDPSSSYSFPFKRPDPPVLVST